MTLIFLPAEGKREAREEFRFWQSSPKFDSEMYKMRRAICIEGRDRVPPSSVGLGMEKTEGRASGAVRRRESVSTTWANENNGGIYAFAVSALPRGEDCSISNSNCDHACVIITPPQISP